MIDEQIARIDIGSLDGQRQWSKAVHTSALKFLTHNIFEFLPQVVDEADKRITQGYALYGSDMYEWSAEKLTQELIEELADALNYIRAAMWRLYKDGEENNKDL